MGVCNVLVFGGHEDGWLETFNSLLRTKQSLLLTSVLDESTRVIRQAIASDSRLSKDEHWSFATPYELAERIDTLKGRCPAPIQAALSCVGYIGLYLEYGQNENVDLFDSRSIRLVGHGIGALAAAVFACASGPSDIVKISLDAVVLCFALGALAQKKIESVVGFRKGQECAEWASLTLPLNEIEALILLDDFNQRMAIPTHKQCYVSSGNGSETTISGPLQALEALRKSKSISKLAAPCKIPLNAPNLYFESDISSLDPLFRPFDISAAARTGASLLSARSGGALPVTRPSELIRQCTVKILLCRADFRKLCDGLAAEIDDRDCVILTVSQDSFTEYVLGQINSRTCSRDIKQVVLQSPALTSSARKAPGKPAIAVVGMAGRFPEAGDAESLWELLQAGRDVHRTIPPERFNHETHTDETGTRKNTSKSPYGCFFRDAGLFDPRFFNMSPKEAAQTDPAQRLMILTAYEALEMAGFVPNRTSSSRADRVATFYGQASDDWREVNSSQDIDTYFIPGGIRAFGPGRINYHLKLSGPSYSVDTACSSSFAAIHMACNSLWAGDCDTAITGGANILTNPDIFTGLSRGHFLSRTGSCKTFDSNADGYCRADGVGSIVLKRLDYAERDKDNILGLILGVGTNHSANAVSITHPHAPTQSKLYRSILSNNGVDPHDVDYVEMHGTGTAAGDYNEMLSVSDVFAPSHRPRRQDPLYVGSVKANIGHGEAAAGISAVIKVLLMLRHNAIPPHVGVKGVVNPTFPPDLESRNVHIPFHGKSWMPKSAIKPRVAFLNNFSAAGGNTALLLQEHCNSPSERQPHPRSRHVITVTAKSIRSMQMNINRLADHLRDNPLIHLSDLSYTLTARRAVHSYRKSFTVSNIAEARDALISSLDDSFTPISTRTPRVVFNFTGQGSLYPSLARNLFETCTSFRTEVSDLNCMAMNQGFPSFFPLLDGSAVDIQSLSPVTSQLGQVCIQLALARLWVSWGITPDTVIGHSLGEYPALTVAGVISASDMIYLVGRRAQLVQEKCLPRSHSMLAVAGDAEVLTKMIDGSNIEISCNNGPNMTVLGGPRDSLEQWSHSLQSQGFRCVSLPLVHAYHTAQVDAILDDFQSLAQHVAYLPPEIPILSPLLGHLVEAGSESFNAAYLCRHARETVDFNRALSSLKGQREWTENAVWLEVGPHPTCSKFVQHTLGSETTTLKSLHRDIDPWRTLSESLCAFYNRGFDISWEEYHRGFEECHKLIDLPSYAWDLKNFWIDYSNDWCLYKGDAMMAIEKSKMLAATSGPATTTVPKILEEDFNSSNGSLLAEADFAEPHLGHIAEGHRVNGVSLCPSSLYADMAATIAKYLFRKICPELPEPALDVCAMSVDKPFILDKKHNVSFRVAATSTNEAAKLRFYTVEKNDLSKQTNHANCEVRFGEASRWTSKWTRKSYLIKERIAALETAAVTGKAHRIHKNLVYKLFGNFVDYDEEYQGIEEVLLDSERFEAAARVLLKPTQNGATFDVPPAWIDSFCHITGFILNASDAVDSKKFVFISHGWKSIRLLGKFQPGTVYQTYTRMQETGENVMEGDVWIFSADQVVGVAKGVKFQRIPRKVIDVLLPAPGSKAIASTSRVQIRVSSEEQNPGSQSQQPKASAITPAPSGHPTGTSTIDQILQVVSSECGVDKSELVDGCTFVSLGIDSLLSLEILAKLRESLGLDLGPHLFLENETIGDLRAQLQSMSASAPGELEQPLRPAPSAITSSNTITPSISSEGSTTYEAFADEPSSHTRRSSTTSNGFRIDPMALGQVIRPGRKANSYLLSGNLKVATKYLFLFPDGSGSATSYATLPSLGSDTCVFGLNCPFMIEPGSWKNGISSVIQYYLEEIRRRQPMGPYNFGGWSAGGILAYEAAWQVQKSGDKVDRLILIDSPSPIDLPPMPIKMFTFLDSVGLLGAGNSMGTPSWVIPHFEAMVRNLDSYCPVPMSPDHKLATTAIWARRGVTSQTGGRCPPKEPGDPTIMDWLLYDRADFSYNGWDSLIGRQEVAFETMDAHHFSMTTEHANELGRLVAKAMKRKSAFGL